MHTSVSVCVFRRLTSTCPLKAAWCRAVRPARSDTLTLLSSETRASAQRIALLLAATWSGVCQFLSRALTSALCFSNTATASCVDSEHSSVSLSVQTQVFFKMPQGTNRVHANVRRWLCVGGYKSLCFASGALMP